MLIMIYAPNPKCISTAKDCLTGRRMNQMTSTYSKDEPEISLVSFILLTHKTWFQVFCYIVPGTVPSAKDM